MLLPWHITPGPEYSESVKNARLRGGDDFDAILSELKGRIRVNPAEATPITDAEHRVLQAFPLGYTLSLYVALDHRRHLCQLEWVEAGPAEPEFDPWD